jgi:hypothetical protein
MKTQYTLSLLLLALAVRPAIAADPAEAPKLIDSSGSDWKPLGEADFVNVNCADDTWTWKDGVAHCTGTPTGVIRSKKPYTNFELVVTWRHLKPAGNSGVFLWGTEESLASLKPGQLPHGIEVQVLDHAFAEQYEQRTGKKGDWFTTNGDVFPTGKAKLTPFAPTSPNGSRSFPKKNTTKGSPEWNHYYIKAVNGEVRLSVNGEEVSGGKDAEPKTGFLCLESEGSPVEFKDIRIRELP